MRTLLLSLLLVACTGKDATVDSGDTESDTDTDTDTDTDSDTDTDTDTDTGPDTGPPLVCDPAAVGECSSPELCGDPVGLVLRGGSPTAAAGGEVTTGLYNLVFSATYDESLEEGVEVSLEDEMTYTLILRSDGGLRGVASVAGGEVAFSGAWSTSDTSLTTSLDCASEGDLIDSTIGYTAKPEEITLIQDTTIYIFRWMGPE